MLKQEILFGAVTEKRFVQLILDAGDDLAEYKVFFPNGLKDVAEFFVDQIIRQITFTDTGEKIPLPFKIKNTIMEQIRREPNFPLIFRGISALLIIKSGMKTLQAPFRASDQIWRVLQDSSTDANYYSKRLILAQIYMKIMIFALSDESENYQMTEAYAERLFKNHGKFSLLLKKAPNFESVAEKAVSAVGRLLFPLQSRSVKIFSQFSD